jgi:hypothetical protein
MAIALMSGRPWLFSYSETFTQQSRQLFSSVFRSQVDAQVAVDHNVAVVGKFVFLPHETLKPQNQKGFSQLFLFRTLHRLTGT